MATYVLVHGSFQGGWIWQPTVELLRAAGHTVYAPTSDGCAERKVNLRAGITVASAARELAEMLFYEDLSEVVLVGTSSGGLIVQNLAVLAGERIQRLVLLDALVPASGERIEDIVERRPDAKPYASTEFTRAPSREELENALFADLQGEISNWALDRATAHPLGLSDQESDALDAFWAGSWKATVIYCIDSPNPSLSHQRRTAERLGAEWFEIKAGHYPMLTDPKETARLLQA